MAAPIDLLSLALFDDYQSPLGVGEGHMTRLMFKPVHMGQLKEMLDQRVWYSRQAPISYRIIAVVGSWLAIWVVFRVLTAFSPYSDTKGAGDVVPIVLIGWFAGAMASCLAVMMVASIASGLMRLVTGKGLYFTVSAPDGLKHLDSTSDLLVGLPMAIGLLVGFGCWFLGFDPSLGLAGRIGIG